MAFKRSGVRLPLAPPSRRGTARRHGFRMICATDACTTDSRERHETALAAFAGYCRQATTEALVEEYRRAAMHRSD